MTNALLLQIERLETRVVAPLKAYGDIVKNKRVSLDTDVWYTCKKLISADYRIGLFVRSHPPPTLLTENSDNQCCLLFCEDSVSHITLHEKDRLCLCVVWADSVSTIQTDLKKFSTDLNRELKELQKLEKIRLRNPADRQSIVSFTYRHLTLFSAYLREMCFVDLLHLNGSVITNSCCAAEHCSNPQNFM